MSFMQILQLEKRLQDQFQVRSALEKALGYRSSTHENMNDVEMPKVALFSCYRKQLNFLRLRHMHMIVMFLQHMFSLIFSY